MTAHDVVDPAATLPAGNQQPVPGQLPAPPRRLPPPLPPERALVPDGRHGPPPPAAAPGYIRLDDLLVPIPAPQSALSEVAGGLAAVDPPVSLTSVMRGLRSLNEVSVTGLRPDQVRVLVGHVRDAALNQEFLGAYIQQTGAELSLVERDIAAGVPGLDAAAAELRGMLEELRQVQQHAPAAADRLVEALEQSGHFRPGFVRDYRNHAASPAAEPGSTRSPATDSAEADPVLGQLRFLDRLG
ncbi:MAG: hypothetical protein M3Y33_09360 [Actinomycetota bacterium]|nr:hypothetical protein [Actinomycetota bacterium]